MYLKELDKFSKTFFMPLILTKLPFGIVEKCNISSV
jgi:hypothetical protein